MIVTVTLNHHEEERLLGDSLAAALPIAAEKMRTATGAAACLTTGTQLCRRADVKRILPDVRVEQSRGAVAAGGTGGGKHR